MAARRSSQHGWLPRADQQVLIGMTQSAYTYKFAYEQAAQGVEPELAAEWGKRAAERTMLYWMIVFPWAVFVGLFFWATLPLIIWKVGVIALTVVLHRRFKEWRSTRADVRLVYSVPTGAIVAMGALWNVFWAGVVFVIWATTPMV